VRADPVDRKKTGPFVEPGEGNLTPQGGEAGSSFWRMQKNVRNYIGVWLCLITERAAPNLKMKEKRALNMNLGGYLRALFERKKELRTKSIRIGKRVMMIRLRDPGQRIGVRIFARGGTVLGWL